MSRKRPSAVKLTTANSPRPSRIEAVAPWLEGAGAVIGGMVAAGILILDLTESQTDDASGLGAAIGMIIFVPVIVGSIAVFTFLGYAVAKLLIALYRYYYASKHFPPRPKSIWSDIPFQHHEIETNWDKPSEIHLTPAEEIVSRRIDIIPEQAGAVCGGVLSFVLSVVLWLRPPSVLHWGAHTNIVLIVAGDLGFCGALAGLGAYAGCLIAQTLNTAYSWLRR